MTTSSVLFRAACARTTTKALVGAVLMCAFAASHAAPMIYSVPSSLGNVPLGAATSSFNVASLLSGFTNPVITGARITASFLDNQDLETTSSYGTQYLYYDADTSYCHGYNCLYNWQYIYTKSTVITRHNEIETFSLAVEGQAAAKTGSTAFSSTAPEYYSYNFHADYNYNHYLDDNYYYEYLYQAYEGYSGGVDLVFDLPDAGNGIVFADGSVDFGVSMVVGSGIFSGATLRFSVDEGPAVTASAPVPEPATIAMVGLGLLGMSTLRSSKR